MMEQEYVLASGLRYLDLIGLNPYKSTWQQRIRALMFVSSAICGYFLNLIGQFYNCLDLKSTADSMDSIPAAQQVTVKLLGAVIMKKQLYNLYKTVEMKWPNDVYGPELEKRLNELSLSFKRIYMVYRGTIWFAVLLYFSRPLMLFSKVSITEIYLPCDLSSNYCYASGLFVQIVYVVVLASVVYSLDAVFYAFLFHAYVELEKIKHGFINLPITEDMLNDKVTYQEFSKLVEHHNSVIKFLDDVNNVYHLQLLNHFITMSAIIVFGVFSINMDGFPPNLSKLIRCVPFLISYHFQLYIYCISGEEVYNQLCSVSDVIYNSKWYIKRQSNLTKGMLLVMQVSHVQNKLSIGSLWKLNLTTFMQVIKTSVSLQAFMQTVYKINK